MVGGYAAAGKLMSSVLLLAAMQTEAVAGSRSRAAAFIGGVRPCRLNACPLWRDRESRESIVTRSSSGSTWDEWAERQKRAGAAGGGGGSQGGGGTKGFFPPVSKWHRFFSGLLRKEPVYSGLRHEDYIEACRSLGLGEDVDEETLADKVQSLLVKYQDDRKKKIMIQWNQDKIMEHRLYEQLHGTAARPADLNLRALDESNMKVTEKDQFDFLSALGVSEEQMRGPGGALDKMLNNRVVRRFSPKRIMDLVNYVIYAFQESSGMPSIKRLIWPGSLTLLFTSGITVGVESTIFSLICCMILNTMPIYSRGEAEVKNSREQRPMKWKKFFVVFAFNVAITMAGYGLGKIWLALKYPSFDLRPDMFVALMANVVQVVVGSGIFVRESTLAVKPGKI